MENLGFGTPKKEEPIAPPVTAEEYVRHHIERTYDSSSDEEDDLTVAPPPVEFPKADEPPVDIPAIPTVAEPVCVETRPAPTIPPQPAPIPTPPAPSPAPVSYRIVGEVFNCYIIVELEMGEKFLLVDKHAAHERINFERLRSEMNKDTPNSQLLLLPIEVMLTSDEVQITEFYRKEIESLGFSFTTSRNSVNLTAIPMGVKNEAVADLITSMADRLKNETGNAELTRDILFEKALYQASCKAAIKGGREYPPEYTEWLIAKLMELPDITVCPHGRPVAMELTKKYIDRQFLRT